MTTTVADTLLSKTIGIPMFMLEGRDVDSCILKSKGCLRKVCFRFMSYDYKVFS